MRCPRTFRIRAARPNDQAALEVLLERAYGQLMVSHYSTALIRQLVPIIAKPNAALIASGRYLVAESVSGDRPIQPGVAMPDGASAQQTDIGAAENTEGRKADSESLPAVIQASGGWSFVDPEAGNSQVDIVHLRHFATDPAATRRGMGRELVARCLREALAAGARQAQCYSSLNAEPFYAAAGFRRVRKQTIGIGRQGTTTIRFPVVFMQCDLD